MSQERTFMSNKILIDVYNLNGVGQIYEIDIGMKIIDIIEHIINTHHGFTEIKNFDPKLIDLKQTRLIYNSKTLEHSKTLEEYVEFQYKSKNMTAYKMHIITKEKSIVQDSSAKSEEIDKQSNRTTSIPITVNSCSFPDYRITGIIDKESSFSFPGTNTFLENQINRLEKRQRNETLRQVSESLNDISNFINDFDDDQESSGNFQNSDKLEKIIQLLSSIDLKIDKLIEFGSTSYSNAPSSLSTTPSSLKTDLLFSEL